MGCYTTTRSTFLSGNINIRGSGGNMRQIGARPPREFIEGAPRRRPSRRGSVEPGEDRTAHIDLRVVSLVELDTASNDFEWNDLLVDIGRSNHATGTARSLGSVAITYIPSKHLNNMLRERFSRDYHDPQKKLRLFRKINAGLKDFIREGAGVAYEQKVQQLTAEHDAKVERQRAIVGHGIAGIIDIDEIDWPSYDDEPDTAPEHCLRSVEHAFGPVTMQVKGLNIYGKGRSYGLDLSLNDPIYEVRNGLIGHLARERLDVSMLRRDWDAHATIFDMHDHVGSAPLTYHQSVPEELKFDAPDTEMFEVPR